MNLMDLIQATCGGRTYTLAEFKMDIHILYVVAVTANVEKTAKHAPY